MQKDYYPVLARAVSTLETNTEAARRAVYDRARVAIMDAGLTPQQTQAERSALETVIARIEQELRPAAAPRVRSEDHWGEAPAISEPDDRAAAAPRRSFPAGRIALLAGAAMIVAAIVGYAVWPRPAAVDARAKQTTTQVAQPAPEAAPTTDGAADSGLSYVHRRQMVYYRTVHPPGTIVISKSQRNLYFVRPNVSAVRYTIGMGRGCTNAVGLLAIADKREAAAPQRVSVSPGRPAGDAPLTLALGDTGLRIDGTEPPVKDGDQPCFTLAHQDMADLYERVAVNARVVIN
jgi:lipoprotein-anchoring transpeptidase ErfK/SrfK